MWYLEDYYGIVFCMVKVNFERFKFWGSNGFNYWVFLI